MGNSKAFHSLFKSSKSGEKGGWCWKEMWEDEFTKSKIFLKSYDLRSQINGVRKCVYAAHNHYFSKYHYKSKSEKQSRIKSEQNMWLQNTWLQKMHNLQVENFVFDGFTKDNSWEGSLFFFFNNAENKFHLIFFRTKTITVYSAAFIHTYLFELWLPHTDV